MGTGGHDTRTVKVDDDSSVEEAVVVAWNVKLEGPIDPPDDGVVHGDPLHVEQNIEIYSTSDRSCGVRFGVRKM